MTWPSSAAGPRERPLRSVPASLTPSHDHLIQAVPTAKLKGDPLLDKADSLMARLPLSGDIGIFNGGGFVIQQSSSPPSDHKSPSHGSDALVSGPDFILAIKAANDEGFKGRKNPQVIRRNQSRRDGTICSPARECRVGFHANRVPNGDDTMGSSHATSLDLCVHALTGQGIHPARDRHSLIRRSPFEKAPSQSDLDLHVGRNPKARGFVATAE
jgi:hypothetical protein